jgi:hypothetical protein
MLLKFYPIIILSDYNIHPIIWLAGKKEKKEGLGVAGQK